MALTSPWSPMNGRLDMLIQNWMSRPVVTIAADASLPMAKNLLKKHNIQALPVIKKEKLVGIVTDADLKRASASDATSLDTYELAFLLQKIRIEQIMTNDPITIPLDHTLAEAADLFLQTKAVVLPVIARGALMVGIISPSDISKAFLCLTASGRKGIELGLQVKDQPGVTLSIADRIRRFGGRIGSLISIDSYAPEGFRQVYIRIYGFDHNQLSKLMPELKNSGKLLYLIDHQRGSREVCAPV